MTYIDIALGLGVLAWIMSRQLRWMPVDTAKMWRLPIVLGAIGLFGLAGSTDGITTVDVAILVVSGLLAVGSGVAMGRLATFRPGAAGTESRTGWLGVGIWVGLVAARVALDVVGVHLGAVLATSGAVILLVLALNRAARTLVFSARLATGAV